MRSLTIIVLIITIAISCKSDDQKFADEQYDLFKQMTLKDSFNVMAHLSAEYVAQHHYNPEISREAQRWIVAYDQKLNAIQLDNKKEAYAKAGKAKTLAYKLIEIDSTSKCNLYKGVYHLNGSIKDSIDLAFLAKYLAGELFRSNVKNKNCPYPLMSQAIIYISQDDYKKYEDGWVSMCSITPENYNGEVSVNSLLLKMKKHNSK